MVDVKEALSKYGYIVLLAGILTGVIILDATEQIYRCEARQLIQECVRLSSTGKTCYNSLGKGTRCFEGWVLVEYIMPNHEEFNVRVYANAKEWLCESNQLYSRCKSGNYEAYYGELK